MSKRLLSQIALLSVAIALLTVGLVELYGQQLPKRLRVIAEPAPPPPPSEGCPSGALISDGSRTDTQDKINAASNGDVVCVASPGTYLWTTTVTIPETKGITFKCGPGAATTIFKRSGSSFPNNQFRLLDIKVQPGNALTRVTGCTFDQDHPHRTLSYDPFSTVIRVVGHGLSRFRIDNNVITGIAIGGVTIVNTDNVPSEFQNGAELTGLIDHNTIRCDPLNDGSCHSVSFVASPAWFGDLASSVAGGWGKCFTRPFVNGQGIGSDKSIYVEDNTFDNNGLDQDGLTDVFGCAQIVFRFNGSNGSQPGNHGFDSAGYRAPRWMEIYRNSMTLGSDNTACGVFRGGGVIYFDNLCDHPTEVRGLALQLFRARPETFITQCDGSSPLDGNVGTGTNTRVNYPSIGTGQFPGWPCVDQTGWHFDENVGTGFQPFPGLIFNNNDGAGGQVIVTNYELDAGNMQNYLKCNRDYYIGNTAYGTVTEGNCSTGGVLRGTSLPGTCTVGVFYWKTDEGTWNAAGVNGPRDTADEDGRLYRCTSTNTWTVYYEPYTYPHPLVQP